MGWELLGRISPRALRGAREQAHWAVQVIAASGESCLAHAADTSHTAMTWEAALGSFVGRALPGEPACRVAVRVADLTLCLLGPASEAFARSELAGRTLDDAYRWTAKCLREATRRAQPRRSSTRASSCPRIPSRRAGASSAQRVSASSRSGTRTPMPRCDGWPARRAAPAPCCAGRTTSTSRR